MFGATQQLKFRPPTVWAFVTTASTANKGGLEDSKIRRALPIIVELNRNFRRVRFQVRDDGLQVIFLGPTHTQRLALN